MKRRQWGPVLALLLCALIAMIAWVVLLINQLSTRTMVRISAQHQEIAQLKTQIDGLTKLLTEGPQGAPPEDFTKVYEIPAGDSAIKGTLEAPVTITGFLDLECPYSARFQPVIEQVLAAYPGRVRFVAKQFPLPFHQQARAAAKAVLAAGLQEKYFQMQDAVLKENRALSEEKFLEIAKKVKLNIRRFKADLKANDQSWESLIDADFQLGNRVEVRGTPTYYINGRKTQARDPASFKAEIDAILNQ